MFGAVCYHSTLTKELSQRIELQQKRSLAVILGSKYRSYINALSLTSLPRLDILREEACLAWAIKAQSNPHHTDLFPLNQSEVQTRWRPKDKEYKCRTDKFYRSAVPSMTRALNAHDRNSKNSWLYLCMQTILLQRMMTVYQPPSLSPLTLCLSLYFTIKNH